jgi:RNA polymerase sigma-70 factor (ECF subfamily)
MKLSERSDESLLRAFAEERNQDALDALVARHWERAFRLALRVVRDPHIAEDVAQETFVRVAGQAARFERDRAFAPWLYAIAINTARTALRSRKRRERHEAMAGAAIAERRSAAEAEADASPHATIDAQLAGLPDELRTPLLLRYGEELSLDEVALALGCPVGTASSRIRRGLERLRNGGVATGSLAAFLRAPVATPKAPSGPSIATKLARTKLATLATSAVALLAVVAVAVFVGVKSPSSPGAEPLGAPAAVAPAATDSIALIPGAARTAASDPPLAAPDPVVQVSEGPVPGNANAPGAAPATTAERVLASRVVDRDGQPIEDARVIALEAHEPADGERRHVSSQDRVAVVRSGADGQFSVPLVEHDYPIQLIVTAPGRAPLVRVLKEATPELRITADAERLGGVVVSKSGGQPVPRVTIVASQEGVDLDYAVSDASGRFAFTGLAPGEATLRIDASEGSVPLEREVTVERGAHVQIEIESSATLVVRAVDARGHSVPASIEFEAGDRHESRSADSEHVLQGLAAGAPVLVSVERERTGHMGTGIADAVFEVTLAPGERKELTATIDPENDATLEALATDAHGVALAGAKLKVVRAPREGKTEFTGLGIDATTDSDGHATFALPAGRYELRLDDQLAGPTIELASKETKNVVAKRPGDRKLAGVVLGPDGKPIAGAQVTFYASMNGDDEDGKQHEVTAHTGADGRFTIEGVPDLLKPSALLLVFQVGFDVQNLEVAKLVKLDALEIKLAKEAPKAKLKVTVQVPEEKSLPKGVQVFFASELYRGAGYAESGSAVLEIPPGLTGRVYVAAPGFATVPGPTVESGKDTEVAVAFPLEKGRTIKGKILDANGNPAKGADISVYGTMSFVDAGEDGSFVVVDAPLVDFELFVEGSKFEMKRVPVGTGEVAPLTITLSTLAGERRPDH